MVLSTGAAPSVRRHIGRVLWIALLVLVAGCAATVTAVDVQLAPHQSGQTAHRFELRQPAAFKLSTGYSRELPAGSKWQSVGSLPQGTVYRPLNTVFSIEGRHVHEAYLVVKENVLQGFFLPGESRYSPLIPSLPLTIGASS